MNNCRLSIELFDRLGFLSLPRYGYAVIDTRKCEGFYETTTAMLIVILPNLITFSDWRRTFHVSWVKTP